MSGLPDPQLRHDRTPDDALAQIAAFDGDLLLDLDETLYLRNSTEDYLDSASPGFIAYVLLRLLDVLKPWRNRGGPVARDWWRLRLVNLLFPWTRARWQRRVTALAAGSANAPLIAALRGSNARVTIVTAGFAPVVTPLIAALGFADAPLIAASASSPDDRVRGKLAMAIDALGEARVRASMVVTDSRDDQPLLDHCAAPLRTLWPDARYRHAFSRVYVPGRYLNEVKRPGQRYIVRGILQEDFAFWVLASITGAGMPVLHVLGLLALLISFWAIYERGYVDNDHAARDYEHDPRLSSTFGHVEVATPAITPWLWAAGTGAIAIVLLRWPAPPAAADFGLWGLTLVASYALFKIYNRLDKGTRIWLFPGLQLARSASFVALVPIGVAASLALGAHVIARWVPYYLYRIGNQEWPEAPFFLSRLMFYLLLWLMMVFTQGHESVLTPTALALMGWNIFRARRDLTHLFRDARRIDR
ncbi:HAD family hydrolase [Nevskia sp.]|uniref:haloacid dehalogenase-like hydrolase n=1 Tax=Nevskia sp. TaxID=1929292 RepID=UPI0026005755|nr:HAD family hydrolase [Nevskia sp.]